MSRKVFLSALIALPLAVAGWVFGQTHAKQTSDKPDQAQGGSFTCPLTGEELPCPNCCPLNQQK